MPLATHHEAPPKQIQGLDLIRFGTAFLVMVYHLVFWRNGSIPKLIDSPRNIVWWGWVGVEIFFVLSGFVIANSAQKSTPFQFTKGRILRLMPTLWICATITFLLLLASAQFSLGELFSRYIGTMLLYPAGYKVDVVYWTLTVEVSFYLVVLLTIKFSGFEHLGLVMIFIGSYSVLYNLILFVSLNELLPLPSFVGELALKIHSTHTFRLLQFHYGCFFALGVAIWNWSRDLQNRYWPWLVLFFLIGCTIAILSNTSLYISEKHLIGFPTVAPLAAWSIATFVLIYFSIENSIAITTTRHHKLTKTLGLMTYPIYLLHNECGLFTIHLLHAAKTPLLISTTSAIIFILIFSFVIVKYAEPPLKYLISSQIDVLVEKARMLRV